MGWHADVRQPQHQEFRNPVVEHALAGNGALFLVIEGGRVVLEVLHERARLGPLEHDFRLALVYPSASGHVNRNPRGRPLPPAAVPQAPAPPGADAADIASVAMRNNGRSGGFSETGLAESTPFAMTAPLVLFVAPSRAVKRIFALRVDIARAVVTVIRNQGPDSRAITISTRRQARRD
jgi:hypothetical protein